MRWTDETVDQLYETIGDQIKAARTRQRVTQTELGKRVGLTRSSIANIEAGRQRVMIHWVMQIAEALDVSTARLITRPDMTEQTIKTLASDELNGQPPTTHEFVSSALRRAVQG
jgi:transcriptional regulator with XRE-family HTH domain